jgi:hypothetical protein
MLLVAVAACTGSDVDDSSIVRGRRLKPAQLSPAAEAAVYDASVHAAFDVGPALVLLLHPRRLPRTEGYAGGETVPADLLRALRARGVVRDTCEPIRDTPKGTPRCNVPAGGYVVRGSDVFRVAGDTVQFHLQAEQYAPATGPRPVALRFEKIYQLLGSDGAWRVVREARVREAQ